MTHRFINADSYASTGQGFTGTNMFAYCNNNPVVYADSKGNLPFVNTMVTDGGGGNPDSYDRNAAVEYAGTWHSSYNNEYYRYTTDCANFVSQCLAAGGLAQSDTWHTRKASKTYWYNPFAWLIQNYRYDWDVGPAWSQAQEQYDYFSNLPGNKTVMVSSGAGIAAAAN